MRNSFQYILNKQEFTRDDLAVLVSAFCNELELLYNKANEITLKNRGNKVYYRGLIEISNVCSKDCFYCGIRKSNSQLARYNLSDNDIIESALYAHKKNFGSIVLQSGERSDSHFVDRIDNLIKHIKKLTNNKLGITLSLGEQSKETYQRWFDSGAHRYLLRIETTNPSLYKELHPDDGEHLLDRRKLALRHIKEVGYQCGSGMMIGLPGQTILDLADDLFFLKEIDVDMVGMGPYIEHLDTPLANSRPSEWSIDQRFELALNMIATLRILMPDINIAATTALQTLDPIGREKGIKCGANVIMPNITPAESRKKYSLYNNKPSLDEHESLSEFQKRIKLIGREAGYGEWGDSLHFFRRK